jgi:hypothetical protein
MDESDNPANAIVVSTHAQTKQSLGVPRQGGADLRRSTLLERKIAMFAKITKSLCIHKGVTFFQHGSSQAAESNAVIAAWPTLPKGVWRFEMLATGNSANSGTLFFRGFTVHALKQ